MKNKKGWLRIVEAFFSLLLISGVLLVSGGYVFKEDISPKVYTAELSILRGVELDDSLRQNILNISNASLPLEDDSQIFPQVVKSRIDAQIPDYLSCKSKICLLEVICETDNYIEKDVYAKSVAITATKSKYGPRQLKLFCWVD